MKSSNAYTLVELLAVISIIVLLLAILLPSLRAAKEKTQGVVCESNLRQVWMAEEMYANDYDNSYTLCYADAEPYKVWQLRLNSYLPLKHKGEQFTKDRCDRNSVYCCPSARFTAAQTEDYCAGIALTNWLSHPRWSYKRDLVCRPSEIIFIGDMREFNFDVFSSSDGWCWWGFAGDARPGFRHVKKANMAFVDGHVEPHKESELEFNRNCWRWWSMGRKK